MTTEYQNRKPPTPDDETRPTAAPPAPPAQSPPDAARTATPADAVAPQPSAGGARAAEPPPEPTRREAPHAGPARPPDPERAQARAKPRGASAAPANPAATAETPPAEPPRHPLAAWHWFAFVAICLLALGLRLHDPLSNPIIGAEDPYIHMERTWDLLDGTFNDYPVGFAILLAPFALLGSEAFYLVVRFGAPFLGAASVAGVFLLLRGRLHPAGCLAAALLLAVMPEHINRTNLLVPTALSLAILPFFFLCLVRFTEGAQKAWKPMAAIAGSLLLVHPWTLILMLPPVVLFWLVTVVRRKDRSLASATGVSAGLLAAMGVLWAVWNGGLQGSMFRSAASRAGEIAGHPASIFPLPTFVDPAYMLTLPALVLGALGVFFAITRRTPVALLALLWSALLVPLVLVDWFDAAFIPHRVVAFLAIGVAILAGLAVSEAMAYVRSAGKGGGAKATLLAVGVLALLVVPSGLGADSWYRLYDEDDYEAYATLDDRGTAFVMAGSWQAQAGYRALTGRDAEYNPDFFLDENLRAVMLREEPDLVVVVDNYTAAEGLPTEFLAEEGWREEGRWGDVAAYSRP